MRKTLIIADSLTNDFAGQRSSDELSRVHVGRDVIGRTIGSGDSYGEGPLIKFLESAVNSSSDAVKIVLIRDLHDENDPGQREELMRFGPHNLKGTRGAEFIDPIEKLIRPHAEIVDTPSLSFPIEEANRIAQSIWGKFIFELSTEEKKEIDIIIGGFWTNARVLDTSNLFRNQFGFPNVKVSPHLVGSPDQTAHEHALQVILPNMLVGVEPCLPSLLVTGACRSNIEALSLYDACALRVDGEGKLSDTQSRLIQRLFLFSDAVDLKPLGGGFSGSGLFLTNEFNGKSKVDSSVVKVDHWSQIQKELTGYHRLKKFLGKNMPEFKTTVSADEMSGIRMDLATMSGHPMPLQESIEAIDSQENLDQFLVLLEEVLSTLSSKLYANTQKREPGYVFNDFELNDPNQVVWLRENTGYIVEGFSDEDESISITDDFEVPNFLEDFKTLVSNLDRYDMDYSLVHGDLNFMNLIADERDNFWVIDPTHAGEKIIETDFCKLENDAKFIINKWIEDSDLKTFSIFDDFLNSSMALPEVADLPGNLCFVQADLRYRKIYEIIRAIRFAYIAAREHDTDDFYRIGLLRYATHTLSFDSERDKGECSRPQLKAALIGAANLTSRLINSDFHKNVHVRRPDEYPVIDDIPRDKQDPSVSWPEYDPVRFTSSYVLTASNDDRLEIDSPKLNPHARTGLLGRGALLEWGENSTIDAILTRKNPESEKPQVLLIKRFTGELMLPGGFVLPKDGSLEISAQRTFEQKIGKSFSFSDEDTLLSKRYAFDPRNTDEAWVITQALWHDLGETSFSIPSHENHEQVDYADWYDLDAVLLENVFMGHRSMIEEVFEKISD